MLNTNAQRQLLALAAGIMLGVAASCSPTRPNQGHCAVREGDAFCAEKYGDERRFCARGIAECENDPDAPDGCVVARPVDDACYSPCGDETSFEEDAECEGIAETGTESTTATESLSETTPSTSGDPTTASTMSMSGTDTDDTDATTEPTTETGPTGCAGSDECTDPGSPVCVDEVCVPCTDAGDGDAACAEKDVEAPACGDDGACVECTPGNPVACDGTTPVCDPGSSSCVGCTYHEQCDAACNMVTGGCFGDCVNVVMNGQDIQDAIEDGCVVQVGAGAYPEAVVVDAGITVAIIGVAEGAILAGEVGNGQPGLSVSGGANAFVQNLEISGNDGGGLGVQVDGAIVYLDRTQVVANTGGGLALTGNANAQVRNCFVGGADSQAAVDASGSTVDILYSTLGGVAFTSPALACSGGTVDVRNSLLVAQDSIAELSCAGATVTFSASEELVAGDGNVGLENMNTNWFEAYTSGDFRLTGTAPVEILSAAQWRTADPAADPPRLANDPAVDIDGDARPDVDGTADVAGAHVP